ncbi:hypothetical protein [Pseudomarimonas salicorniae]|uniref:Uncharacterized protein n=1 Tax=Pseudomarimonas salicorniae TaxID=2933270 RepID=A0ABT0GH63_9GAMM|nr:hypothetical protein [Lysobacter sp. CAU 1642]MCK7593873.1 hypothetical protein [Lysobacter sp. CAU 1642]
MPPEHPLRNLLIDCRIALRRAGAGDQGAALGGRIDAAIREIDRGQASAAAAVEEPSQGRTSSQQVALAWQTACRGLMLAQPQIYSELRDKVMGLLDQRELRDPDQELLAAEAEAQRLHSELAALRTRLNEMILRAGQAQTALGTLRDALEEATREMTGADAYRDAQSLALARVEWLANRQSSAVAAPAGAAVEQGPMPSQALLQAVAGGSREFSQVQREWVVGEALGLTGWSMTPVELLAKGDAWLASKILEGQQPAG